MPKLHCGIDFGTSNSTLALADAARAWLVPLEDQQVTLPTAVFCDAEAAPPLFGRAAILAHTDQADGRLMRGLKSTLGSALIHEKTPVGGRMVAIAEVITDFFTHLKQKLALAAPGIDQVVIGRPVHFVEDDPAGDRAAEAVLRQIAHAIGFKTVAFQFEPIAAALHYEQSLTAEQLVLIVDIGGGTSDFSIVRLSPTRRGQAERGQDILANDGIRVGGTDFDRLLSLGAVMPDLGLGSFTADGKTPMPLRPYHDLASWHRINTLYTVRMARELRDMRYTAARPDKIDRLIRVVGKRHGHALAFACEQAKIALSLEPSVPVRVGRFTGATDPMTTRVLFETLVAAPLLRLDQTIRSVLQQAEVGPSQIGTVFLTGGSSAIPAVHALVGALLPQSLIATGDNLGAVGTGLAIDARRRFG